MSSDFFQKAFIAACSCGNDSGDNFNMPLKPSNESRKFEGVDEFAFLVKKQVVLREGVDGAAQSNAGRPYEKILYSLSFDLFRSCIHDDNQAT